MLLACDPNNLQEFSVFSLLTEEARKVLCKLPNLQVLRTAVLKSIPIAELPNLTTIDLTYRDGHHLLQGFRGAPLGKLQAIAFHAASKSTQIGNFLEDFQTVALLSSIQNTLSSFIFRTQQPWNPNYASLLEFKQLRWLEIEFSCSTGCSSRVDNDIVINLARAMPKLETLQLGKEPCDAITGITLKGLISLARYCPKLSRLCIHFRALGLAEAGTNLVAPHLYEHATPTPMTFSALTKLQVGEIPIRKQDCFAVALALVQIFPFILHIEYANLRWMKVLETIHLMKRIGGGIYHTSKLSLCHSCLPLLTLC